MPAGGLITAGAIGAGGSILSGIFGKNAAQKAAEVQRQAAVAAGQHVEETTAGVNPYIVKAASEQGQRVVDAAGNAATGVGEAVGSANKLLAPYSDAGTAAEGTLKAGLTPGGDFNKTPTLADLTIDPGYKFREEQSEQAAARQAAATGSLQGGGFAKALNLFSQQNASQEYQNAFNRFEQSTQNRFGNLFNVANSGQAAANVEGANLTGGAKYAGDITTAGTQFAANQNIGATDLATKNTIDAAAKAGEYTTQAGSARASGIVGGTNAFTSGLSGAASGIGGALSLGSILKNPTYFPNFFTRQPSLTRVVPGSGPSADAGYP